MDWCNAIYNAVCQSEFQFDKNFTLSSSECPHHCYHFSTIFVTIDPLHAAPKDTGNTDTMLHFKSLF